MNNKVRTISAAFDKGVLYGITGAIQNSPPSMAQFADDVVLITMVNMPGIPVTNATVCSEAWRFVKGIHEQGMMKDEMLAGFRRLLFSTIEDQEADYQPDNNGELYKHAGIDPSNIEFRKYE